METNQIETSPAGVQWINMLAQFGECPPALPQGVQSVLHPSPFDGRDRDDDYAFGE